MSWKPKRNSRWRDFLTDEEEALVIDAERKRQTAQQLMAEARMVIAPIQNRAIHRAKYATQT